MLDAAFLMGSYAAMSAGMSAMIAKVSPSIGPRMRHLFAGSSPLAVLLAMRLEGGPSTTLDSMDLFSAGGLLILGIITSSAVGKVIPTPGTDRKKLSAR